MEKDNQFKIFENCIQSLSRDHPSEKASSVRSDTSNLLPLIKKLNQRLPNAKIVLSNILSREDNQALQRNVEYVNAAINRKFATMDNVVTVKNSDIGKKLKKDDGIHVTDIGRSRLASHIKDSIVDVLKLKLD